MSINRRDILTGLAVAAPAVVLTARSSLGMAETTEPHGAAAAGSAASAFAGKHAVAPLPFDPKTLNGISERMIVSHHDNNYAGAVKNLNKVEKSLASINKDTPGLVAGLKERELTFTNSAILHQHYFGNLGGSGKPSGAIERRLAAGYGSFAQWEENFRAVGNSLGGGSGWAIVDFNFHTGDVRTYWSAGHIQSLSFGAPLLVMDMYEHAYAIDYGSAAGKYIDAFFKNINWDEVNHRLERGEKAAAALRA